MEIVKKEQKVFIERIYCRCGKEMQNQNIQLTTHPPQYKYVCSECGFEVVSFVNYPSLSYEEID